MQPALKIYEMNLARQSSPEDLLHVTFYSPQQQQGIEGILLVLHDVGEHADSYRQMAKEALVPAGYAVVVPDLPGFGQSIEKPGVSSISACIDALETCVQMLRKNTKSIPLFLMGHGMGASVALSYLMQNQQGESAAQSIFHAVILTSPWLGLPFELPELFWKGLGFLGKLFPQMTFKMRRPAELLTNDRKAVMDREQDKFVHNRLSLSFYHELWLNSQHLVEKASRLPLPLLLMYGTQEKLVSLEQIEALAARLPQYMNAIAWPDFLHDLHQMEGKEAVFQTLLEYMGLCLKRGLHPIEVSAEPEVVDETELGTLTAVTEGEEAVEFSETNEGDSEIELNLPPDDRIESGADDTSETVLPNFMA